MGDLLSAARRVLSENLHCNFFSETQSLPDIRAPVNSGHYPPKANVPCKLVELAPQGELFRIRGGLEVFTTCVRYNGRGKDPGFIEPSLEDSDCGP